MATEMKKPLCLAMPISDISKILMYVFRYNQIIPKYGGRAKLYYADTDSFIIYIKTEDFFEEISNDFGKWFDTPNYNKKNKIPLPIQKNKKVPSLFKDELRGKTITEFAALKPKTYSYLDDNCNEHKKAKCTKKMRNKTKNHVSKFPRLFVQ